MRRQSKKPSDQLHWLNRVCHIFIMLIMLLLYMMCILVVRCNADADSNPESKADPDALWDKLPALQSYHSSGDTHSSNPLQSFTSLKTGNLDLLN